MENKNLSLKDFVKKTLLDINEAVCEAKEEGLSITHGEYGSSIIPQAQDIVFDLSVSTENSKTKDANAGVVISVINATVGKKKELSEQSIN